MAFGFCFIVLGLVLWHLSTLPAPSGCDMDAMPTVRRENTMEAILSQNVASLYDIDVEALAASG